MNEEQIDSTYTRFGIEEVLSKPVNMELLRNILQKHLSEIETPVHFSQL
jgi:hypothetical protein